MTIMGMRLARVMRLIRRLKAERDAARRQERVWRGLARYWYGECYGHKMLNGPAGYVQPAAEAICLECGYPVTGAAAGAVRCSMCAAEGGADVTG